MLLIAIPLPFSLAWCIVVDFGEEVVLKMQVTGMWANLFCESSWLSSKGNAFACSIFFLFLWRIVYSIGWKPKAVDVISVNQNNYSI